jgi:hypothetical protein
LVHWLGGDWDVFCLVGPSLLVRSTIQQDHSKVVSRFRIGFEMRSISVSSVPARRFRRSQPHFNFYATFAGSTLLLRNNHTGYSNTEVIYSVAGSLFIGNKGVKVAVVTLRGCFDTVIGSNI